MSAGSVAGGAVQTEGFWKVLYLILVLAVLAALGYVAYQIYRSVTGKVADAGNAVSDFFSTGPGRYVNPFSTDNAAYAAVNAPLQAVATLISKPGDNITGVDTIGTAAAAIFDPATRAANTEASNHVATADDIQRSMVRSAGNYNIDPSIIGKGNLIFGGSGF